MACDEINTPECTDDPCQGDELPLRPVGPCTCPCNSGTPKPYYTNAEACEEAHKQVIIQSQYVTGLTTAGPFLMPACQGRTNLLIPGLQVIPIGVYLWNPAYGYLKVIAFDFTSETVTVLNECQTGNVPPGTQIPTCTVFTVVDTPCCGNEACSGEQAPAVSGSLVICTGNTQTVLAPTAAGQVPVSTGTGDEVAFQSLAIESRDCTTLTADFTYIMGNAGPYVFHLADTSIFQVGELLQIGTRTDRILVTHITSGIQLEGTVSPVPAAGAVVPSGTAVCLAPCCEQILYTLKSDTQVTALGIPVAVGQGQTALTLTTQSNIPNYGPGAVNAHITSKYFANLSAKTSAANQMFTYEWYLQFASNLCAIGAHTPGVLATVDTLVKQLALLESTAGVQQSCDFLREHRIQVISIPAGQELVITTSVIFGVSYVTTPANDIMQVDNLGTSIVNIWLGH